MEREEAMLAASSMYYLQDAKMDTIANHLHMSRSSVSRLLRDARESGLVEITLRPTPTRGPGLAKKIEACFGIEVHVVPVADLADEAERLDHVAAIARHLGKKPTRGSAIVQLNGAANVRTSGVEYAGNLIARFGEAFDAQVHLFPVPAFFDFAETRNAMWSERSIVRVLEYQRRADIALFSIGAIAGEVPSHVYSAGYLEASDIHTLDKEGIVGDVCTIFLREDGTHEDLSMNARATGPTPAELRSIPRRICGVAGDNKVVPLLAALRAGVITDLVVDEQTATKLVEQVMALASAAASDGEIAFQAEHSESFVSNR